MGRCGAFVQEVRPCAARACERLSADGPACSRSADLRVCVPEPRRTIVCGSESDAVSICLLGILLVGRSCPRRQCHVT